MKKGEAVQDIDRIIDESIELELNAAALYLLFHFAFPEDKEFWWQLHKEERGHASLLTTLKDTFLPAELYPESFVPPSLSKLQKVNRELKDLLEKFRQNPPPRGEAFQVALQVENDAGEMHFQQFAEKKPQSKIEEVFQTLISDDKDHVQRIFEYMHDIVSSE